MKSFSRLGMMLRLSEDETKIFKFLCSVIVFSLTDYLFLE